MRSFTSSRPVWSASRTARASVEVEVVVGALAPRQLEDGVEPACGSSRAPGSARVVRSSRSISLRDGRDARRRRRRRLERVDAARGSRRPTSLVVVVLAQLLADGVQLLAQQELALLLLHALGARRCGSARPARARPGPPWPSRAPARPAPRRRRSRAARPCARRDRSGHQPARSASAPGSSTPRSSLGQPAAAEVLEQRSERGPQLAGRARGPARSGSPSSTGSASTQSASAGADHAGADAGPAGRPGRRGPGCRRAGCRVDSMRAMAPTRA